MRTVAIIQARMGSSRLPGKVLQELAGAPMLERVVKRVRRARSVDEVVVATTREPGDDVIATLCDEFDWRFYRGSEADVLDRYYQAAKREHAEVVVRVTSDCPLIEPAFIDRAVAEFRSLSPEVDYVCNFLPERSVPRGTEVEVVRFRALERAWYEDWNPDWREHVTPYINRNPQIFMVHGIVEAQDNSDLRWTVDTPEDLELVRLIYEHFRQDHFSWTEVLELLRIHPDWIQINQHVPQKAL